MHQTNISECTILQQKCAHVCTFLLQNGAFWDMGLVHSGIYATMSTIAPGACDNLNVVYAQVIHYLGIDFMRNLIIWLMDSHIRSTNLHIDGLVKDVTPLLTHWIYVFLVLAHQYSGRISLTLAVLVSFQLTQIRVNPAAMDVPVSNTGSSIAARLTQELEQISPTYTFVFFTQKIWNPYQVSHVVNVFQ